MSSGIYGFDFYMVIASILLLALRSTKTLRFSAILPLLRCSSLHGSTEHDIRRVLVVIGYGAGLADA